MKKWVALFLAAAILLTTTAPVFAAVRVRGYFRSNGTYVQPHYRSYSDGYRYNNWSSWGNYNPYTGKKGYKRW
ncbi:hypothetical protein ciss_07560 [Carboxydothermus islandicus]|uniref:Uncharacterized protein n=1 Tax=Carboxydothermus islandicus TaxID=661089 RepID=A0A1L8D104_9THEO|nr:hypothetical protein [Carboxydothermus islandicus]GAV24823.1 hypothetical protein ciss_07560 [Carboxydothermus islandicus]